MTLRQKVIEAGARSFHDPGVEPHDDDRHLAALALDAMLDCLTENADELRSDTMWSYTTDEDAEPDENGRVPMKGERTPLSWLELVDALRGDR